MHTPMRATPTAFTWLAGAALMSVAAGCAAIAGLDDYQPPGAGGPSTGGSGGQGAGTATGGGGQGNHAGAGGGAGQGGTGGGAGQGGSACPPNQSEACYTGPSGTENVGPCHGGTHQCNDDGSEWGPCAGEVTPESETCADTADEDCSGADCVQWSWLVGDDTHQGARRVAADSAGNVYAVGFFTGSLGIGNLPLLSSSGGNDAFLVKFDATGMPLWSQKFGLAADQNASGVAVDASDNVIIAGDFTGTIQFGTTTLTTPAGEQHAFVAKFDPTGSPLWSAGFLTGTITPVLIAVDEQPIAQGGGNVVVAGTSLGGGNVRVFVRRYSAAGALGWTKSFGLTGAQYAEDVAVDPSGNILLAGQFSGTVNFGGGTLTALGSGLDSYLVRLDPAGNQAWAKRFGDSANDQYGNAVAVAPSGNVVTAGAFYGTINLTGSDLSTAGDADVYLASFSAAGAPQWSMRFGDAALQSCRSLAVDGGGNVLLTGWFNGAIDFGGGALMGTTNENIFLAKLNTTGQHLWSRGFGDDGRQFGHAVTAAPSGNVLLAAEVDDTVNLGGEPLTSAGLNDALIASFAP